MKHGLQFSVMDGETVSVAPSAVHVWSDKKADWVIDSEKQAALDKAAAIKATDEKIKTMKLLVQELLDSTAQKFGFDNIEKAMLGAQFDGEHQKISKALGSWYYSVWSACKKLLQEWQAGEIAEPTVDVVITALPVFETPTETPASATQITNEPKDAK